MLSQNFRPEIILPKRPGSGRMSKSGGIRFIGVVMDGTEKREVIGSKGLHYWQGRAFFSMGILYLFYYFCKYNLSAATKDMQDDLGLSSSKIGLLITIFSLTYAGGQFLNGYLGDRFGPKRILLIGAFGGVIVNVCFGLSSTLAFFAAFWAANAYFSSCGWAPGSRIMFNWFPRQHWGKWMGIFNALCYTGSFLVFPIATYSISRWGWRSVFFVCPAFLLVMAILYCWLGKSSPHDAGLTTEWDSEEEKFVSEKLGKKDYWEALTNRKMNLAYLSGFGANFIRWGILSWMVKILAESISDGGFGMTLIAAGWITSFASLGGAFFSILMGIITDKVFKGSRWQMISFGLLVGSIPLLYLSKGAVILDQPHGVLIVGLAMFLSGGLIQAVQTPLFDLPGDILGRHMSGTGVGIMDGWMYLGAAFAGVFMGWWLDNYGYGSGIQLMGYVGIVSGLIAIPIQK